MDKTRDLSLHRARSWRAVIADGYRLYATQFFTVLRSSWLSAAVYAAATGAAWAWFFTRVLPLLPARGEGADGLGAALGWWALLLAAWAASALALAAWGAWSPQREHCQTGAITGPARWWGRWPLGLRAGGVLRAALLLVRRRKGRLMATLLTGGLVVLAATAVLQLPAVLLGVANVEAQAAVAALDDPGMPQPLFGFNMAVFGVFGFIQAYIHLSVLYPLYYAWGSEEV